MGKEKLRSDVYLYDFAGEPWNTGTASYWIDYEVSPQEREVLGRSRIISAVRVKLGQDKHIALLDTGAMNTVLCREQAEALADQGHLEWLSRWTKHYSMEASRGQNAQYAKVNLTFLANVGGQDLLLPDVTVVVPDHWTRLVVVGMGACLERVRFALDSPLNSDVGRFYFAQKQP